MIWCKETGDFVSDTKERIDGADRAQKEFESRYKQLFGSSVPREALRGSNPEVVASIRPQSRGRAITDMDKNAVEGKNAEWATIEDARTNADVTTNADEATNAGADERERSRPRPGAQRREDGEEGRSLDRSRRSGRSDRRSDDRGRSRNRMGRRSHSSEWARFPECKNKSDSSLSRELAKYLMGRRAFETLSKEDFASAARIFGGRRISD